jgi:Zn-dependent peptidase ImmA (M78 family)
MNLGDILSSRPESLGKVARKAAVQLDRLQEIAQGAEPSLAELRKITSALKMSPRDLVMSAEQEPVRLLFRTNAPSKIRDSSTVDRISSRVAYSLDLIGEAQELPKWLREFHVDTSKPGAAEYGAALFRKAFFGDDQYTPLTTLPQIVADLDIVLLVVDIAVDGASAIVKNRPFVLVARRFPPRMLFTLAHEIGHLIAHHDSSDFVVIDEYADASKAGRSEQEAFAHAFASALLMPPAAFGAAIKRIREKVHINENAQVGDVEIGLLSRIFGVSFAAAANRCEMLELLPRGGAASLTAALTKKYSSPEQRGEELGLPPRPSIDFPTVPRELLESAIARVRSGEISLGRASAILGLSTSSLVAANSRS